MKNERGMLQETIDKLEHKIRYTKTLTKEKREELTGLVRELRTELTELEKSEKEQAESIADFAHAAARESLRAKQDEQLLHLSAQGLKSSIRKFEVSHPNLTRVIQSICLAFGV
jgi:hypothetical protein